MEKRITKKDIYGEHGINLVSVGSQKYLASDIGLVCPPLVNGNEKIGKGVFHFSTLPGTADFTVTVYGKEYTVKGTCACDCRGCYAKTGNYRYQSVKNALGMRTILARDYIAFLYHAITAQIKADKVKIIRIHAAGDFFSNEYADMWARIVKENPDVKFWTYTKVKEYENLFSSFENANIVKSVIPGKGFNFGHCDYIADLYADLKTAGKTVHVCKCGIDKSQHCVNCKGCIDNEFVLFLEHGTEYKADKDPEISRIVDIINNQ